MLREVLQGKRYEETQVPDLAPALAEQIKQAVRGEWVCKSSLHGVVGGK